MKRTGEHTFESPREAVREDLPQVEVLARGVPGCGRLERVSEQELREPLDLGFFLERRPGRVTAMPPVLAAVGVPRLRRGST